MPDSPASTGSAAPSDAPNVPSSASNSPRSAISEWIEARKSRERLPVDWTLVRNGTLIAASAGAVSGVFLVATKRSPQLSAIPQMTITWGALGLAFMGCRQLLATNSSLSPPTASMGAGLVCGVLFAGLAKYPPSKLISAALLCGGLPVAAHKGYDLLAEWRKQKVMEALYQEEVKRLKQERGAQEGSSTEESAGASSSWFPTIKFQPISDKDHMESLLQKALKYDEELRRKEAERK